MIVNRFVLGIEKNRIVADYGELIEDHLFKDLNVRLLCFYPVLVIPTLIKF